MREEPPSNALTSAQVEQSRITVPPENSHQQSASSKRAGDHETVCSEAAETPIGKKAKVEPQSNQAPAPVKQANVLDFLKSRPQLAGLRDASKLKSDFVKEGSRKLTGEATEDRVPDTRFEGDDSAWQQNESVVDFLRRLPVEEPATAAYGPWLWVGSPFYNRSWKAQDARHDLQAMMDQTAQLLVDFAEQRSKIEKQNPGKPPATITRKLGPYRDVLEENILSTAVKTGMTIGKWMLFPLARDLPRVWRTVAEATAAGKLGPMSKVATYEPDNATKGTLICVYTYNFADFDDVKRVLHELAELNLVGGQLRTIFYKCDAYTHLKLFSDNPWKIKASLHSSKDVLEDEVKVREDSVVARLSKKSRSMEDFFK